MSENGQDLPLRHELIDQLARDAFLPALQEAVKKGQEAGANMPEMLNAAANSYAHMLEQLIGLQAAAGLMAEHAQHMRQRAEATQD